MYKVGLTGNIGSGKSTAASIIQERKILVLDADEISREMTSPGSPIASELANAFGSDILDDSGNLDRKELGIRAFSSEENTRLLVQLVTDKVVEDINSKIRMYEKIGERLIFIDAPLLFECEMDKTMDEVWTIAADDEIRMKRVWDRDKLSEQEFLDRDSKQMNQSEKMSRSEIVIYNNEDKDHLREVLDSELRKLFLRIGKTILI